MHLQNQFSARPKRNLIKAVRLRSLAEETKSAASQLLFYEVIIERNHILKNAQIFLVSWNILTILSTMKINKSFS